MTKPTGQPGRRTKMKKSSLERNEFLFSGKKFQVSIPEGDLRVLKNESNAPKRITVQACWNSFRILHFLRRYGKENPADGLTKALDENHFKLFQQRIGIKELNKNVAGTAPTAGEDEIS
jgi:hypothetical protein